MASSHGSLARRDGTSGPCGHGPSGPPPRGRVTGRRPVTGPSAAASDRALRRAGRVGRGPRGATLTHTGPRRRTTGSAAEATVPSRPWRNDPEEHGLRAGLRVGPCSPPHSRGCRARRPSGPLGPPRPSRPRVATTQLVTVSIWSNRYNQRVQWTLPPPPETAAGISGANQSTAGRVGVLLSGSRMVGRLPAVASSGLRKCGRSELSLPIGTIEYGRPCRSRPPARSIPSHGSTAAAAPKRRAAVSRQCLRAPTIDHDSIRVDGPSESFS